MKVCKVDGTLQRRVENSGVERSAESEGKVSRQQTGVLTLMFKAQRQVRLRRDTVELV